VLFSVGVTNDVEVFVVGQIGRFGRLLLEAVSAEQSGGQTTVKEAEAENFFHDDFWGGVAFDFKIPVAEWR
jgi:hypothetical protein